MKDERYKSKSNSTLDGDLVEDEDRTRVVSLLVSRGAVLPFLVKVDHIIIILVWST